MLRWLTAKRRYAHSLKLGVLLAIGCGSGVLAATKIGLPYAVVKSNPSEARHSERDVEVAAGPVVALEEGNVEIAPDAYSSHYRSGIDVYRELNEGSFDDEPMLVVYAKADPALALPEVVVIPASRDINYTHITAAERIIDPIARGEDLIFLRLGGLADQPETPPSKPKQRRFFSQESNL